MKPVLVLQHLDFDGPAYLGTWLRRQGLRMDLRCAEQGESLPGDLRDHAGMAILGGAMSANDDLAFLRHAEHLVREAVVQGIPTIGHCLGGQLMARALGAPVHASPAPEVGWQTITRTEHALARQWLGDAPQATVFQWHAEAFGLPDGATLLAGNAACAHQAFAIGPHLAMQFHIELDAAKLAVWAAAADDDYRASCAAHPRTVQSVAQMLGEAPARWAAHQALADRLYSRWWAGVVNTAM